MPAAQQELRRLSDETGMFGSITDEAIAANAGKTYQDVTAMRDPLAGLTENLTGMEVPTADTSVFDFNSRHDPSDGRFTSGGGSGKIEKTKYAPSPQRSESKIQLKPKTYARLTGVLNTQYPGLLAGEKVIIRDANYQYHVTADGFGGLSVERRIPITNRRKKMSKQESVWVQYVREHYEPASDVEMSYEDENNLLWLLNAPAGYQVEDEMLEYAQKHLDASMKELIEYFDEVAPDGLTPGDDGLDLEEN